MARMTHQRTTRFGESIPVIRGIRVICGQRPIECRKIEYYMLTVKSSGDENTLLPAEFVAKTNKR